MSNQITFFAVWCLCATPLHSCQVPQLSPQQVHEIGRKIWKNECNCSEKLLAFWNQNEDFPSFGIGHFIWFPAHCTAPFSQTFPDLLTYLQKQGVTLPGWLKAASACPWKNREEFYSAVAQPWVQELRTVLTRTIDLQAQFIVDRLHTSFQKISATAPQNRQKHIVSCFDLLARTSRGCFALIDYLNFKGDGTSQKERYAGHGWGLLQVLDGMKKDAQDPIYTFIASARAQLERRVAHSPNQNIEQKWLSGWLHRISSYNTPSPDTH